MANSYSRVAPPADKGSSKASSPNYSRQFDVAASQDQSILTESVFHSMLTLERRRAERSRKPFVLMLIDANLEDGEAAGILRQSVDIALASSRETDLVGWYKEDAILGIIFTEVNM